MKKLLVLIAAIALLSFTEEDGAKVILVRKGLYSGVAGDVNIFIDGKLICEIRNNSFSTQPLQEGKHTFSARWYSKDAKQESKENSIEIDVKNGHEYYVRVVKDKSRLVMEELTGNSWNNMKEGLKQEDCH